MNSGIENYRTSNLNMQQNYLNPTNLFKNMPNQQSNNGYSTTNNQHTTFFQEPRQLNQIQQRPTYPGAQINPITLYKTNNQQTGNENILSQIDLIEKDINNIFSNNITPDRLERLGSGDIQNGMPYDIGSLNPKHQMLGEFEKPTNLVHNNITKNIYAETMQEYTIIIDSSDRDIKKYPNPFSYRVKFSGLSGSNDATIMQKFDNVKFIKLDTGIIPTRYYYVKQDASLNNTDFNVIKNLNLISNPVNSTFNLSSTDISGTFAIIDITDVSSNGYKRYIRFGEVQNYPNIVDVVYEFIFSFTNITNPVDTGTFIANNYIARYKLQQYSLANDKYTLLYIDEFENSNENSTNDIIGKSFSVMFPDGCNCNILYTSSGFVDKMFKFALLGQINQMTINIKNSNGTQLKNSQDFYTDMNIDPNKQCICTTDTNGYFIRNYKCVCTYFRHPYYQKFQNTLIFRIGVIETNIDKTIFS